MRRLAALALVAAFVLSSCALLGGEGREYRATFDRAVQLFPGSRIRVQGVDVGRVKGIRNVRAGVEVTFTLDRPEVQLPVGVEAAIIPSALLGERYIQLFPVYQGGPVLPEGSMIPLSRTAVPSEPDELLRSLQDYLGAIDPDVAGRFISNAAVALDGIGEELNSLIEHGSRVMGTLADKRDDLAVMVVQFDRLSRALATRQEGLEDLIHTYNTVARTLTENRDALEGTIDGLTEMSRELASLLLAHRGTLHEDIRALTRTGRTFNRNIESFARTGHWARRLFAAASRAVNYDQDWLRLVNQGEQLEQLILERFRERLTEWCDELGLPNCSSATFWERRAPSLFCFEETCPRRPGQSPEEQLAEAIQDAPKLADSILDRLDELTCEGARDEEACLEEREALEECLDAANPRGCLRKRDIPVKCLRAENVSRCLERERSKRLEDAVGDLLEEAGSMATPGELGSGGLAP